MICKTVRPMLSDHCLYVLSVTLVYCGQTVGCIKVKLGMEVGLSTSHIVLDGDWGHSSPPPKGTALPQFLAHVCCGQTAGWINVPLLGPGHVVLDGDPAPPQKIKRQPPNFQPMSVVAKWLDGSRCHLVRR